MHALFQLIGNSIHPSIRLEVDYLSRHENGKLPILHLHVKVWIEKRRRVGDGGQDRAAMYKSCYMSSTTKMLPPNLLVNRSMSEKRPEVRILEVKKTSML